MARTQATNTQFLNKELGPIKGPSYYTNTKFTAIDVIEDWGLDFMLGNVLKYVQRAGKKPGVKAQDDLRKAITYLRLKIERLEVNE